MVVVGDLIAVRSQRAARLKAHLDWLSTGEAWTRAPWLIHAGLTLDQVYVEPDVVPWNRTGETRDDEEKRALGPWEDDREGRRGWSDVWPERQVH